MPTQLYDKEEILHKCLAEFAKNGYHKTSVVSLAKAAGVSRTLILHHFNSKKNLYLEIVDLIVENAGKEIDTAFLDHKDSDFFTAREQLSRSKFRFSKNNPMHYAVIREIMTDPPDELSDELRERFGERRGGYERRWKELFEKVPLRNGVDRERAYEFVQMTLDHFDNKYFAKATEDDLMDEQYFKDFLEERNSFLEMLRYGIQSRKEDLSWM